GGGVWATATATPPTAIKTSAATKHAIRSRGAIVLKSAPGRTRLRAPLLGGGGGAEAMKLSDGVPHAVRMHRQVAAERQVEAEDEEEGQADHGGEGGDHEALGADVGQAEEVGEPHGDHRACDQHSPERVRERRRAGLEPVRSSLL